MEGITFAGASRVAIHHRREILCRSSWCGELATGTRPGVFLKLKNNREGHANEESGNISILSWAYGSDYLADSIEVMQWESGKSLDAIAAAQGIKIRRHSPMRMRTQSFGASEVIFDNHNDTPLNILQKIIWDKDEEVKEFKARTSISTLIEVIEDSPPTRDFIGALKSSFQRTGMPALIAEVKKASPSRGILRKDFDPVKIAETYEKHGASCLSVLTDKKYFQGSFDNLEMIRKAGIECPLLCKEFIIDAWQLYYARAKGADAVLLIAGVLPDLDIKMMTMICRELGLAALVEVHNECEMDRVLRLDGIQLIGINNRNLETFEVDISNTKKLLSGERGKIIRERGILVVGESGLFVPEDIAYVQDLGVGAVLVGESLIKQDDPGEGISKLYGKDISKQDQTIVFNGSSIKNKRS